MQYSPISYTSVVLLSHIISWVEQKGGFSVRDLSHFFLAKC